MAGSNEDFLSRWSRRKREARAGDPPPAEPPPAAPVGAAAAPPAAGDEPEPLPPVADLTPESDFTPFMDDKVDPGVRREALKKLFSDPRFNVMDGMDVYVDDYSIPDPLPAEWLGKLSAMAGLGDVPGRQKAEREARERAEREAQSVAAGGEGAGVPQEVGEAVAEDPGSGEMAGDDDKGQTPAPAEPSGCDTRSIPARKLGN